MKPKEVQPEGDDKQECGEAGTSEPLEVVKVVAIENAILITIKHVPLPQTPGKRKVILTNQWPSNRA